jgi:hypothetical protein
MSTPPRPPHRLIADDIPSGLRRLMQAEADRLGFPLAELVRSVAFWIVRQSHCDAEFHAAARDLEGRLAVELAGRRRVN